MTDPLLELETLVPKIEAAKKRKSLGGALTAATQALNNAKEQLSRFDVLRAFLSAVSKHVEKPAINPALDAIEDLGRSLERAATVEDFQSLPREIQSVQKRD